MAADKRSFVLYFDLFEELEMLSIEQRGQWITAIFNYVRDGELPTFEDLGLKMMFSQTRRCLDRDAEKYARICARNSANGAKGGRPPKNRADNEKTERFSGKAKKPIMILKMKLKTITTLTTGMSMVFTIRLTATARKNRLVLSLPQLMRSKTIASRTDMTLMQRGFATTTHQQAG